MKRPSQVEDAVVTFLVTLSFIGGIYFVTLILLHFHLK